MACSIRSALIICIVLTAAKQTDCFLDFESENGNIIENTDIVEPIRPNIFVRVRISAEHGDSAQHPDTRQHSDTRQQPDVAERVVKPSVIRSRRAIDNTKALSDVEEHIENHPIVRPRPIAQHVDYVPGVSDQIKQEIPPINSQVYKPNIRRRRGHKNRQASQKNNRQNRENEYTESGPDVSERYDYNPIVHRSPVELGVKKVDIRLIFPWMEKTKKQFFSQ